MAEIGPFQENPRWRKIQDVHQNFKIDSVDASGTPSLSLKFGINITQND